MLLPMLADPRDDPALKVGGRVGAGIAGCSGLAVRLLAWLCMPAGQLTSCTDGCLMQATSCCARCRSPLRPSAPLPAPCAAQVPPPGRRVDDEKEQRRLAQVKAAAEVAAARATASRLGEWDGGVDSPAGRGMDTGSPDAEVRRRLAALSTRLLMLACWLARGARLISHDPAAALH